MKIRSSAYFLIAILPLMVIVIIVSAQLQRFSSKLLPLTISSVVFVLAAIQLGRELLSKNVSEESTDTGAPKADSGIGRGYLFGAAWVVGFCLGVSLLGFLVAIPLFVLFYFKTHGINWLWSIGSAAATVAFTYGIFEVALGVVLYRGLVFI